MAEKETTKTIPAELIERGAWVLYRIEVRDGKETKVPYNANSPTRRASTTDAQTWASYEKAREALETGGFDGLGYVFSTGDPYAGIDLDDVRDPYTGALKDRARKLVERFDSYTEVSPSGTGVHILVRGEAPNRRRRSVEAYSSKRFFTMTGRRLEEAPATINERQDVIDLLAAKFLEDRGEADSPRPNGHAAPLSDGEVLDLIRGARNAGKFSRLFDAGDTTAYDDDDSRADQALVSLLAFYTQDHGQLDRLFRQGALCREKWTKRADYRRRTIDRAIEGLAETWSPPRNEPGGAGVRGPAADGAAGDRRENPLLQGRVLLARGIEEGIEPPEELEPGVLLRGKVHQIFAGAASGKTMLALWLVKRAIERGERVLFFDMENGHRIISERLGALGVDTGRVDELLYYIPSPSLVLTAEAKGHYEALLDEVRPALVVFDSWINFLASAGLEENANTDIATWAVAYAHPAKDREVTMVLLDHVPHEGSHARGASRKRDEVDVQWRLYNTQPFDRESVGEIVLHREKDREAWLPPSVRFSVGGAGERGFVFARSAGTTEEPAADGLTPSQGKALEALQPFGEEGARYKVWKLASGLAGTTFDRAKDQLVRRGYARKADSRYFPNPRDPGGGGVGVEDGLFMGDSPNPHEPPPDPHGGNGGTQNPDPRYPHTHKGGGNGGSAGGSGGVGPSGGSRPLSVEEVGEELRRTGSGPAMALRNYLDNPGDQRLEYLTCAVLKALGAPWEGWERHAPVVEEAAGDPQHHPLDCGCEGCL